MDFHLLFRFGLILRVRMDLAVQNYDGDAMRNRQRLKCPGQLKLTSQRYQPYQQITRRNYGDDTVADLLSKMNYRVCNDGFYIPSPDAPRPTMCPAFTFDSLYQAKPRNCAYRVHPLHLVHSTGHQAKIFSESNVYQREKTLEKQRLLSLPSCQYTPSSSGLRFTPNLAESILTEETSIKYNNFVDINRKSPHDCILDDALDNIDERKDGSEEEETSTWKAKDEQDSLKPEEHVDIFSLACSTKKLWEQPEIETLKPDQHDAISSPDIPTTNLLKESEPETQELRVSNEKENVHSSTQIQNASSSFVSFWQMSGWTRESQTAATRPWSVQMVGMSELQQAGRRTSAPKQEAKRFTCDVCGKGFDQSYAMRNHWRIHTGERPYQCDICERSFSDRSTWRKHRRIHTGVKPFKCDVCGKLFAQSGNMYRHKRNIHSDDA